MAVIRPTALIAGPQGPAGPAGAPGAPGAPGPTNIASASVIGATRLSVDPVDPATPIAVGDNDPRLADRVSLAPATSARNLIASADPAATPLSVRLAAGSTVRAFDVQNSAGSLIAGVDQFGNLLTSGIKTPGLLTRIILNNNGSAQGNVLFQAGASNNKPLVAQGSVGQTVNLQEWQDSAGTSKASVNSGGGLTLSGGLNSVGGHTLTNSGTNVLQVSATAITTVPIVARGMVGQTGNLQEWQDSTSAAKASIDAAGVASVSSLLATNVVRAKNIQDPSGSNIITLDNTSPTTGRVKVNAAAATDVVLVAKGAASQSGNLHEWQNSTGTALSKILSDGTLQIGTSGKAIINSSAAAVPDGARFLSLAVGSVGPQTPSPRFISAVTAATEVAMVAKGAVSQSVNLQEWQNSGGTAMVKIAANGDLTVSNATTFSQYVRTGGVAWTNGSGIIAQGTAAGDTPIVAKMRPLQSVDGFQVQDSGAVAHFSVSSAGLPKWANAADVQTTVGAAGLASALPATPTKYLKVVDDTGATLVVPAYAAA